MAKSLPLVHVCVLMVRAKNVHLSVRRYSPPEDGFTTETAPAISLAASSIQLYTVTSPPCSMLHHNPTVQVYIINTLRFQGAEVSPSETYSPRPAFFLCLRVGLFFPFPSTPQSGPSPAMLDVAPLHVQRVPAASAISQSGWYTSD